MARCCVPRAELCVEDDNVINQVRILSITGYRDTAPPARTITQQQQQTALCSPSKQNIASKFCVTVGGSIRQSDIHSPNILTLSCIYSTHRGHHSKVETYMYVVEVNNPHIFNFNPPIFYEQSLILPSL